MENNMKLRSELRNLMIDHRDEINKFIGHYKPTILTKYQNVNRMKQFNKHINHMIKTVKGDHFKPLSSYDFYDTLLSVLIYFKSELPLKAKLEDLNRVYDSFDNSIDEILKMIDVH